MTRTLILSFENAFYYITAGGIRKEYLYCLDKETSKMFNKTMEKIRKKIDECEMSRYGNSC